MGVDAVGDLSLGEWAAICRWKTKANNPQVRAPTEAEFEAAILRVRGVEV